MAHPRRFAVLFDLHYGHEIKSGHRRPMHDPAALAATLDFLSDFKPHDMVLGGDILDAGVVSHHNHGRPRRVEGLRLLAEAEGARKAIIEPLEAILPRTGQRDFIVGNHEDWIEDLLDREPGLEGLVDLRAMLGLERWRIVPQGQTTKIGKLWIAHGDQITGGEHVAKAAVSYFGRNIAFGHHHSAQLFTMTSALDTELPRQGMSVGCLCRRDLAYGEGKPNRWAQGFLWGWSHEDGTFSAINQTIINGRFVANGKVYGR